MTRPLGEAGNVPHIAKEAFRNWCPPIAWRALQKIKAGRTVPIATPPQAEPAAETEEAAPAKPEWEMAPDTDAAWTKHEGWSHASIAALQKEKWPSFLASVVGSRALGLSHEAKPDAPIDDTIHNMIMTFGYALGRTAAGRASISVLDWGGGVGHYAVYARALFPHLKIDYTVCDLAPLCAVGRDLLPDVEFIDDPDKALAKQYDLVFASSAIQYSRDIYGVIAKLCAAARDYLMITRSPFVPTADDFVVVQRPYAHGYMSEYAAWFLNRGRFKRFVEQQGLALQREFLMAERPFVPNAVEQCRYEGFLFERPVQT
jgi:putative methyltransferase (TIGR04325 family)